MIDVLLGEKNNGTFRRLRMTKQTSDESTDREVAETKLTRRESSAENCNRWWTAVDGHTGLESLHDYFSDWSRRRRQTECADDGEWHWPHDRNGYCCRREPKDSVGIHLERERSDAWSGIERIPLTLVHFTTASSLLMESKICWTSAVETTIRIDTSKWAMHSQRISAFIVICRNEFCVFACKKIVDQTLTNFHIVSRRIWRYLVAWCGTTAELIQTWMSETNHTGNRRTGRLRNTFVETINFIIPYRTVLTRKVQVRQGSSLEEMEEIQLSAYYPSQTRCGGMNIECGDDCEVEHWNSSEGIERRSLVADTSVALSTRVGGQFFSSNPSEQSQAPSHFFVVKKRSVTRRCHLSGDLTFAADIHWPLGQWRFADPHSTRSQFDCTSSAPEGQSWRPSQRRLFMIHGPFGHNQEFWLQCTTPVNDWGRSSKKKDNRRKFSLPHSCSSSPFTQSLKPSQIWLVDKHS